MLVLAAFDGHAQRAAPPEYSYGSIPFGQTARRILSELSGATVETDEGAEAFFIGQYEVLPDFFTEGLYRNWLGQLQLSVEVTRRYRVSHASWENVQSIDLFFFRDHTAPADIGSYRLFMVRKTLDTGGDGSHTEVSEILEQAITRSLGIDPVSYDVKNVQFTHALGMPARISAWATADSDIFLLVFQNVFFGQRRRHSVSRSRHVAGVRGRRARPVRGPGVGHRRPHPLRRRQLLGPPLRGRGQRVQHGERLVPAVAEQSHDHPPDPESRHLGRFARVRDRFLKQRYLQRVGVAPGLGSQPPQLGDHPLPLLRPAAAKAPSRRPPPPRTPAPCRRCHQG